MSIQHEHTLHPITALEFYRDHAGFRYVLAGEGSFLKVFEEQTSKLVCFFEIFEGQTIHGIAVREGDATENGLQLAIWGGSCLALIGRRDFQQLLEGGVSKFSGAICTVSDWALDAVISPHEDDSCVIVTAHNTLIQAKLASDSLSISIEEFESPSRSILYSANLLWESPSQILVAAGTVFGEIIVWQFIVPRNETRGEGEVLFTFMGHEGSIFGVNISPPITLPDNTVGRILASCSDDRTIRIWDTSVRSKKNSPSRNDASPRETGFGSNGESTQSTCMAMAMGHASRIWRVKILTDELTSTKPTQVNVLSFGEDATTQQWALITETAVGHGSSLIENGVSQKPPNDSTSQLVHTNNFSFHEGKHIWSAATYALDAYRTRLVTGGADGKIACQEIKMSRAAGGFPEETNSFTGASANEEISKSSWDLEEVVGSLPHGNVDPVPSELPVFEEPVEEAPDLENPEKKKKRKKIKKVPKDAFNRYAFVSENIVLVTTNFGRVLLGHISESVSWEEISLPELNKDDLRSYAVVEGIPETGHVYLAGANGNIFGYLGGTTISWVGKVEGKVADMFKIFDPQTSSYELLVTTLNGTSATLFSLGLSSASTSLTSSLSLELPERLIVTSAAKIEGRLIFGSRIGTFAIYDAEKGAGPVNVSQIDDDLNGDAITAILSLPQQTAMTGDDKNFYFLTTSRKGIYAIYACNLILDHSSALSEARIRQVHRSTPPFSSMVEHAWSASNQLFLYGFKGKNFTVWNETQQCEIMSIECGGAHRSYAYSPIAEGGHFIYTKASKLYLHSRRAPSSRIIKRGGHGREIKTCAVSDERTLIATGAEDTTIRIWRYDENNRNSALSPHRNGIDCDLTCLAVIQKHTTGIQHLSWHGSRYLFSSGGTEEFFVWAVEEVPGFGIGVVCEATCPDRSEDKDLRIMSFDVSELVKSTSSKDKDQNGGGNGGEALLLISLAYSDSTIRTYTYTKTAGFSLLATGLYTSSCLMQIRHVDISEEDGEVHVVTAATDGNLALWKCLIVPGPSSQSHPQSQTERQQPQQQQLSLLSTHKVHQNSIKALDIATSSRRQIVIATGGDDNALGISLYDLSNPTAAPKSFIIRSAHAAAITGLCFISNSERVSDLVSAPETAAGTELEQVLRIVTSSNDQKVKEWDVRIKRGGEDDTTSETQVALQVNVVGDVFTPVADVGDLAALGGIEAGERAKRVLVVGNGMEVWRVGSI